MDSTTTAVTIWSLCATTVLCLWLGYLVASRRYFHPLSHVPGPFLWAVSGLPIFYHQHFREGNLIHALMHLHATYGPVVRISPTEVHLSDPENYDKIYNIGSKFLKDPGYYSPIVTALTSPILLTVIDNNVHKARRGLLNPFFSRRSVLNLENIIWDKINKMCDILQVSLDKRPNVAFDFHRAVRAVTVDIITEYAYAGCWNQLDKGDFGASYQDAIRAIQTVFVWFQTFPILMVAFRLLPEWLRDKAFDSLRKWDSSLDDVRRSVAAVRKEITLDIKPERRTIFHDLLEAPAGSEDGYEKQLSDQMVFSEAVILTGAGTETTGSTAERAVFEVLSDPVAYKKLTTELREAFPDPSLMTISGLEKLPYLTGVLLTGVSRLNPGVPGHLPRVVAPGGATFNGIFLPHGTVVSMSAWVIHQNPHVFPMPQKFEPYRWIGSADEVHARERALVPFSKGSRSCLGQNLATFEIYCAIGALFRRFDDLAICPGIKREDFDMVELLIGYHPANSPRFKVVKAA
ncbi:cytochrome P450 [Thozetella sp. PMI_491]|nr:cytochrome P450 [Thozetella sp. PMI_491]